MFKAKLKASAIHGLITAFIAALTAVVVFWVWYPGALAEMLSGVNLYLIVLAVELCLGPLISLVIFNPNKPVKELIRDYAIVGLVQLSALVYGLYSVAISRPVFEVFVRDRIEIVSAVELNNVNIQAAKDDSFKHFSWLGTRFICVEGPTDALAAVNLYMSGIHAKNIQLFPKYYRECHENEVSAKTFAKEQLFSMTPIQKHQLPVNLQEPDFKWLPVSSRFGGGIAIYLQADQKPIYVNLDPHIQKTSLF